MNQDDKTPSLEPQDISELYQTLKTEQVSEATDNRILALAREGLKTGVSPNMQKHQHLDKPKTNSLWRRWHWPLSIAASVMFICVIFIQQYDMFKPHSTALAPQDFSDIVSGAQRPAPAGAQSIDAQKALAETEALALKHNSDEPTHQDTDRFAETAKQALQARQAEQKKRIVMADKAPITAATEQGIAAQHIPPDWEKIEQLQLQINAKQVRLFEHNQSINSWPQEGVAPDNLMTSLNEKQDALVQLKQDINQLQIELFKQMVVYQQHNPAWQAEPETLRLLSVEQQLAWRKLLKTNTLK
ncbi:MAG: hypothetical protein NWQ54_13070 [Paraglaciecola sp.]|nr:hypothetical protein [Paraglaciecola sp.]